MGKCVEKNSTVCVVHFNERCMISPERKASILNKETHLNVRLPKLNTDLLGVLWVIYKELLHKMIFC